MSTQTALAKQQIMTVEHFLKQNVDAIQAVLPKGILAQRLLKAVQMGIRRTPALAGCTQSSLLACVMECASLGLQPGVLGQAWFIPFKNEKTGRLECQLVVGYRGLLHLARNTGELKGVSAQAVHTTDKFDVLLGTDPKIHHVPDENPPDTDKDVDAFRAAYVVFWLQDGGMQFDIMFRKDVEKIRGRSKAADKGPWRTDYDEMAKKTVIRRAAKLLPASVEKLQRAAELDELAEMGKSQDLEGLDIGLPEAGPAQAPPSKLDAIVADAKNKKAVRPAPPPRPPADSNPATAYDNPNYSDQDPEPPPAPPDEDLPF